MTVEQLVGSLLIALVTALATAFFNNLWEERRLQTQWEREKEERRAQYKHLRLEEKLKPLETWVKNVIELADTLRQALHLAAPPMPDMDKFRNACGTATEQSQSANREFAAIDAMLLSVGDRELTNLLQGFYEVWTELLEAVSRLRVLPIIRESDRSKVYQEWAEKFGFQRELLREKGVLLLSKIESKLEEIGNEHALICAYPEGSNPGIGGMEASAGSHIM